MKAFFLAFILSIVPAVADAGNGILFDRWIGTGNTGDSYRIRFADSVYSAVNGCGYGQMADQQWNNVFNALPTPNFTVYRVFCHDETAWANLLADNNYFVLDMSGENNAVTVGELNKLKTYLTTLGVTWQLNGSILRVQIKESDGQLRYREFDITGVTRKNMGEKVAEIAGFIWR